MTSPTTSSSERPGRSLEPIDAPEPSAKRHRDLLRTFGAPVIAVVIFVTAWQVLVASGWRPDYLLPGPAAVFERLGVIFVDPEFWPALACTLSRAVIGFAVAVVVGTAIGLAAALSGTRIEVESPGARVDIRLF